MYELQVNSYILCAGGVDISKKRHLQDYTQAQAPGYSCFAPQTTSKRKCPSAIVESHMMHPASQAMVKPTTQVSQRSCGAQVLFLTEPAYPDAGACEEPSRD